MDSFDEVTLNAFLAALMRQENSLPADLQNELKEIGKTFSSNVGKLHALAKKYSLLEQEYMSARSALQDDGERFRSSTVLEVEDSAEISDDKLMNFAVEVLNADDSVNFVKKAYTESSEIGQFLFQLRRQTSFMVRDAHNIPQEELWVWEDPTVWDSLERGLRQAQAGEVHDLGSFAQYADLEIDD